MAQKPSDKPGSPIAVDPGMLRGAPRGSGTPRPNTRPVVGDKDPAKPAEPEKPKTVDYRAQARLLYPWIPEALLDVFVDAWAKYGDPVIAMGALRADPRYEHFFPGNRRPDGSVIANEAEYLSTMEGYDHRFTMFGLNPADFGPQKIRALQNGRSPNEVEADLGAMYIGIVTKGDTYRKYFADKYGAHDVSNTALLGSALTFYDENKASPMEFQRRIHAAQIGGAAGMFGFDIARQEADRLESFGLQDEAARTLYARAKSELPTLNTLQQRFEDPADPLTIEHYADALVLNSPEELNLIGRLYARDKAQFSQTGLFAPTDRVGAQGGLLSR